MANLYLLLIASSLAVFSHACTHGEYSCNGQNVQVCDAQGNQAQIPCADGQVCKKDGLWVGCVVGSAGEATTQGGGGGQATTIQAGGLTTEPCEGKATTQGGGAGTTEGGQATTAGSGGGGEDKEFADSYDQFASAVASCGYTLKPTEEQYKNAVGLAKKDGDISSRREFAMFLTEIMWESGGLKYKKELNPPAGHYTTAKDIPGQQYYGRGYIQLSWHYNYYDASMALYGDDRLARNADVVATDDSVAWATAFWFWKARVHNKPGVQEGKFGAATKAINGGLECGAGQYVSKAKKRFECYKKVHAALKVKESVIENGCYN